MTILQFTGAFELGLIYGLVALGVFITFRVLNFPDLTVDGSFPLGAAVSISLISSGIDPLIATLSAVVAGCLTGVATGILTTRFKVLDLISGIITMTALYSINIRVMQGRPNISILDQQTFVGMLKFFMMPYLGEFSLVVILGTLVTTIIFVTYLFLSSEFGLALRATGNNARMARANGISDHLMILVGLAISNGLIALGGSLFAQENGFSDVNMGIGTIIAGFASVILGEAICPARRLKFQLMACIIGAITYRSVVAIALNGSDFGLEATDLNLVTAVILALALIYPRLKGQKQ